MGGHQAIGTALGAPTGGIRHPRWWWLVGGLLLVGVFGAYRQTRQPVVVVLVDPALSVADGRAVAAALTRVYDLPAHPRREQAVRPAAGAQVQASAALAALEQRPHCGQDYSLALVNHDGGGAGRTFLFGLARLHGRCALVFAPRLRSHADSALFQQRLAKVAVHELGHVLGLSHCPDPHCAMFFSSTVLAVDSTQGALCAKCSRWLRFWRLRR